jgi:RND family efflux transporter MFP subunit
MIKYSLMIRLPLYGAIASLLLVAGCESKPPAPKATAVPVKLQTLTSATLIDSSEYIGVLQAKQAVNLAPQINGRILKFFVEQGAVVQKGRNIVQLRPIQQQEQVNAAIGNLNVQRANLEKTAADLRTSEAQRDATKAEIARSTAAIATAIANYANSQEVVKTREADLQRAESSLNLAQINYKRSEFLVKTGVQPQQDLDNKSTALKDAQANTKAARKTVAAARASVRANEASVTSAQAALAQVKQNLKAAEQRVAAARAAINSQKAAIDQATGQLGAVNQDLVFNTLSAPIDGIVGNFDKLRVGDFVNTGQVVTTITDNQVFDLNVNVPTANQNRLRKGLPVEIIKADGSSGVKGQVTFIAALVEQNAQSILVKMTFRNDGSLRNNQYVRVRMIWEQKPGVLIPATAVSQIGGQNFVFVAQRTPCRQGDPPIEAAQIVCQRLIQVGEIQEQNYQVIKGLSPGDAVAVSNILNLRNGVPVKPES